MNTYTHLLRKKYTENTRSFNCTEVKNLLFITHECTCIFWLASITHYLPLCGHIDARQLSHRKITVDIDRL
jgi:hypothetical protein